jgi:hypothetical protein
MGGPLCSPMTATADHRPTEQQESEMQTAKIKTQETYAMWRAGVLVRFYVAAIVTRRVGTKTENTIEGYVLEDTTPDGQRGLVVRVEPSELIGPYEEQALLVQRKAHEEALRKAAEEEKTRLALLDRLALYAFVGQRPPKKADDYEQPFMVRYGRVRFDDDGIALIVARVHALESEKDRKPESVVELGPRLVTGQE